MNLLQGLTLASRFVTHRLNSTSVQVLHSPFVYRLYTECIKKDKQENAFAPIEQLRHSLLQDQRVLTYSDPGSGSHVTKNNTERTVKLIATHSLKPAAQARVLHRLVNYFAPATVLELGTSLGLSSCYMAAALPANARLYTVEGAAPVAAIAQSNLEQLGYNQQVHLTQGLFDEVLPALLPQLGTIDFAYLDGNHRYAPTVDYVKQLLPYVHNNSVIILDDIYWSNEMQQAWQEVKQLSQVTVSIDLFHFGLLFFRKEQVKEYFTLTL